jgi:hypothetical protein
VKTGGGETFLIFDNKKMRGGEVGKSYKYKWDINYGKFVTVTDNEIQLNQDTEEAPVREKKEPTAGKRARRRLEAEDDY